jgi:hypothetical protein
MGNANPLIPKFTGLFLLGWVLANIVGLPGMLVSSYICLVVLMYLSILTDGSLGTMGHVIVSAFIGAGLGAWLGLMQSLSLRAQRIQIWKWVTISSLGAAIGVSFGFMLTWVILWILEDFDYFLRVYSFNSLMMLPQAAVGLAVGVAQWSVLRQRVHRAGWWVIALPVCFALAAVFIENSFWITRESFLFVFSMSVVGVGCFTGILLGWLFRFPKTHGEEQ